MQYYYGVREFDFYVVFYGALGVTANYVSAALGRRSIAQIATTKILSRLQDDATCIDPQVSVVFFEAPETGGLFSLSRPYR
jgi:hypothetical protein